MSTISLCNLDHRLPRKPHPRVAKMSRYPPINPSDLSPEQQTVYDETSSAIDRHPVKLTFKDGNGALIGPYAPLLHTPAVMQAHKSLAVEIGKILSVSPATRETAILATSSVFQTVFELHAHTVIAAETTGLTERQISMIKEGRKPEEEDQLDDACDVAFDMAVELSRKPGPLSEVTWKKACDIIGKQATLALIHFIALYAYTCILLNGADVLVPE